MDLDQTKLDAAVRNIPLTTTDATIAAMPGYSTPILSPRTGLITVTTLAASTVWGFAKVTAFQAALQAVIAAGSAQGATTPQKQGAAAANTLLAIVTGPGFDATDPQVQSLADSFVALGQGTITDADVVMALNTSSYTFGVAVVAADITASRVRIATRVTLGDLIRWAIGGYQSMIRQLNAVQASQSTGSPIAVPTKAALIAANLPVGS